MARLPPAGEAHALQGQPAPRPGRTLAAKGFRPFFLLAGLFALAIMPVWLLVFFGALGIAGYLDASSWHAHEMIFGFAVAVIAGFLLTAVGNWTQRETAIGPQLLGLAALWIAGRAAMLCPVVLPVGLPALLDLSFLPLLIGALARPLLAARNLRNYPLLVVLAVLFACNGIVHAQALGLLPMGSARRACLVALDVVLLVVLIIIGRVLPMFTRNATQVADIRSHKALDFACLSSMVVLAVSGATYPQGALATGAAGMTALLAILRAWHWGIQHTLKHPLLWVLHSGYAWLVVGLALRALAGVGYVPHSLATHALTVGAIGTLTLGMMARVALGHTGRVLTAPPGMPYAFIALNTAAAARSLLPWFAPAWHLQCLWIAGALWSVGYLIFVFRYAPLLCAPRVDGKPG